MRVATVRLDGRPVWGLIAGDTFRPVAASAGCPTLRSALEQGRLAEAVGKLEERATPVAELQWLPVVPDPGKILCVGLNYENHRQETGRAVTEHPTFFTRFADSQTGHGAPLLLPRVSERLDYEGELAIVIGKPGRAIPQDRAMEHVAGYSCYNDGSVRDWQRHTTQFTPGKNFPGTGAFGPWLVTPDDFGTAAGKRIRTILNGDVMQDAMLDDMIFKLPKLIEYASTFTPLAAGDVIVTGTPGGVGIMRDPPVFMKEGDRIEVEIDGIGTLANRIAHEA